MLKPGMKFEDYKYPKAQERSRRENPPMRISFDRRSMILNTTATAVFQDMLVAAQNKGDNLYAQPVIETGRREKAGIRFSTEKGLNLGLRRGGDTAINCISFIVDINMIGQKRVPVRWNAELPGFEWDIPKREEGK
jgi:hypothetical protein